MKKQENTHGQDKALAGINCIHCLICSEQSGYSLFSIASFPQCSLQYMGLFSQKGIISMLSAGSILKYVSDEYKVINKKWVFRNAELQFGILGVVLPKK